jgi:hypothetical protein
VIVCVAVAVLVAVGVRATAAATAKANKPQIKGKYTNYLTLFFLYCSFAYNNFFCKFASYPTFETAEQTKAFLKLITLGK